MKAFNPEKDLFLPFQNKLILDKSPRIIIEKSRQIGASYALAYKIFDLLGGSKKTKDGIYVSQKEEAARKFLKDVVYWCRMFYGDGWNDYTANKIRFPNGSTLYALSSNPDNLRGYSAQIVVLDEFAFIEEQNRLYTAALPLVTRQGQLIILSTHAGPTYFSQLCSQAKNKEIEYNHYKVTLYDALDEGLLDIIKRDDPTDPMFQLPKDQQRELFIQKIRSSCTSEAIFDQEYLVKVSGEGTSVVSADMYYQCQGELPDEEYKPVGTTIAGIDIGISDLTVIWVMEIDWTEDHKPFYRPIHIQEIKGVSDLSQQTRTLSEIISKYEKSLEYVVIDNGSVGRSVSDQLTHTYGNLIIPTPVSHDSKKRFAEAVRRIFEEKRIVVPKNSRIQEDISAMSLTQTAMGNASYRGSTSFSHCDYFCALGLAILPKENSNNIEFVLC